MAPLILDFVRFGWQRLQGPCGTSRTIERLAATRKRTLGFGGYSAKSRATNELAMRLLLVVYNLWVLFVRFIEPKKHTEAKRGRRWFLLIATRLVQSA